MAHRFGRVAAKGVAAGGLVATLGVIAASLTAEQGCSEDPSPASAPDPIVIGVSLGLTRDLDSFTAPLRDAVKAAEGEINAAGGLLGRPVSFDVQDDRSDEGEFVQSVANDFVRKGAVAVIGPVGSQQVKLTHDIYAGAQILQLTPSATSTDLATLQDPGSRFLFRTTPDDAFQGAAVMLFAEKTPRGLGDGGVPDAGAEGGIPPTCNKLAIVNIDNAYGNSMADVIEKTWPSRGPSRSIPIRKRLSTDLAPSYEAEATEIIATQPECLVLISYEDTAAKFVRDFKSSAGYQALDDRGFFFIGTDGVFTAGFLADSLEDPADPTSKSFADEDVFGTNPDTQPGTPEYNQFRTIYASYFPLRPGADAPAFAANTFDAAVLIAFAIQKAGTVTDRIAIRDALKEVARPAGRPFTPSQIGEALVELRNGNDINYTGASGNCDLEDNGNVKAGFIVWEAYREPTSKRVEYRTVDRFTTEELQRVLP